MNPSEQDAARQRLRELLALEQPFAALTAAEREQLVAAAEISRHRPGDLVLDGFRNPSADVHLVLQGRVGLWHEVESYGQPDDTEHPGGFFGFSAMLTGRSVGPRARALTRCTMARIPGDVADAAFVTPAGARFLTDHLLSFADKARLLPGYATTGSLVEAAPEVVDADTPLTEVARSLTERRQPGIVVRMPDGSLGLVTDGSIRRRVLVEGLPVDAPASQALSREVPVVQTGDSAGEVLLEILEARTDAAIVTDRRGRLKGVVGLREFSLSPTSVDVVQHEQLRLAASREELVTRARRTPEVLGELMSQGLAGEKVIRVYSGLVDTVVRRAIELCFAEHPELPVDGFTWLALGSNGRREAVLSSDVESAVVFPDDTDEATMARYRAVFAEVHALLAQGGLAGDEHGVGAQHAILARTGRQWREAAAGWLADPYQNKGAVMISLMFDSRPVHGDPSLADAATAVQRLHEHPQTLRAMLTDALTPRARIRQWEVPWRRTSYFDIKHDALAPLVNLARWVALAVRAEHVTTPDRLRAAAGTTLVDARQAPALVQSFEVMQRLRLRSQLAQLADGKAPTDRVDLGMLSPIDRTILDEAVHEVAVAQKRLTNVASWSASRDWQRSEGQR